MEEIFILTCLTSIVLQAASAHKLQSGLVVKSSAEGDYQVLVDGDSWLQNASTFLRSDHKLWTTDDGTLLICGQRSSAKSGADGLGRWQLIEYGYRRRSDQTCLLRVSIKSYTERNIVIFTQTITERLHNSSSGDMNQVVTSFPSFKTETKASLGMLNYAGTFIREKMTISRFSRNMSLTDGIESGPIVLFDQSDSALVISTFSQFMSSSMWHKEDTDSLHWGVMGKAASIPANHSTQVILYYSPNGIRQAISEWGNVMRIWYKKEQLHRQQDMTISHLGYYTDNGAYYYHNMKPPFQNYEQMFLAEVANKTIPYRYLQYDDWWYFIKGPGYGGTVRWEAIPDIFPHGLRNLYNKTGMPVLAHNRYWSNATTYAKQNGGPFEFIMYQHFSMPVDQAFWEWLFSRARQWGMITYEQDWLNYQTERIFQLHSDIRLSSLWLDQMGAAADKLDLNLQYCMALPRHVLHSLTISRATQVRVSIDYHLGEQQWRIGISSMLADAVGLAPFKDNFWTTSVQNGNPYNKTERSPVLEAMVSILSAGPVAPGDKYGLANPRLIAKLHRADGLLLKPQKPAFATDSQIHEMAFNDGSGPKGEVWSTYSDIGDLRFGILFAVDLKETFAVHPRHTGFRLQAVDTITYKYYENAFSGQVFKFGEHHPITLSDCPITEPCLWYLTPSLTLSGREVAILGELDKFVPMSPQRVLQVSQTEEDIQLTIQGVPGEIVTFSILIDGSLVNIKCTDFKHGGQAKISITQHQCIPIVKDYELKLKSAQLLMKPKLQAHKDNSIPIPKTLL